MLDFERLAEQRIVEEIDLSDRKVVRSAPIGSILRSSSDVSGVTESLILAGIAKFGSLRNSFRALFKSTASWQSAVLGKNSLVNVRRFVLGGQPISPNPSRMDRCTQNLAARRESHIHINRSYWKAEPSPRKDNFPSHSAVWRASE